MVEVKIENQRTVVHLVSVKSPKALKGAETEAMAKSVNDLKKHLKADAARSKFTGEFMNRISGDITGSPGDKSFIGKIGSDVLYSPWVEFGRAPGRFPNIDKLRVWVQQKTGSTEATFAIASSIAQKGTLKNKRHPYESGWAHTRAVADKSRKAIQKLWGETVDRYIRQVK
jgi:hypothetical protein